MAFPLTGVTRTLWVTGWPYVSVRRIEKLHHRQIDFTVHFMLKGKSPSTVGIRLREIVQSLMDKRVCLSSSFPGCAAWSDTRPIPSRVRQQFFKAGEVVPQGGPGTRNPDLSGPALKFFPGYLPEPI